jgi:sterol desaturase/sphingolipid hydroxylase (fatty acid hydroxylase superfamily)
MTKFTFVPLYMDSLREQILIIAGTPVYAIIIGLEVVLSNYHQRKLYTWKDTAVNVYLMLLNATLDLLFRGVCLVVLDYFYRHHIFSFSHVVVYWVMLLLLEDFMYYWLHRFDHEVRLFWAVHVTHHSSEHFNFTVGFRSSVFQPLYRFMYFIPLALMGFKPLDILFIYAATQIWGVFVHTKLINKMGWLEYFLVTPSHHRVHHASNPKYLDKNMGMFLIIWDKMFGTFQPELTDKEYQPIKFGLTKAIEKETPVTIIFHEWTQMWKDVSRKDLNWKEKWNYLFGPPGWSHDGSRLTSDEMRAEEDGQTGAKLNEEAVISSRL